MRGALGAAGADCTAGAARAGPCNSETIAIGDRVTGKCDRTPNCPGTVLGFRRQDGTRVGDTSGGLNSKGCVRVDFDGKRKWNTTDRLEWEPVAAAAGGGAVATDPGDVEMAEAKDDDNAVDLTGDDTL